MIDLEDLYFEWLMTKIEPDGVEEGVIYICGLLHNCEFHRRVGNDINRAIDGANLRKEFLELYEDAEFAPHVTNKFMRQECSWLEMLLALARHLDYLYDGGIEERFLELVDNMQLGNLTVYKPSRSQTALSFDQHVVDTTTSKIDQNRFREDGRGGIFPLKFEDHADQREVEIWDQHAAYFLERL